MSFVSLNSYLYSVSINAMACEISCCIGPRYNDLTVSQVLRKHWEYNYVLMIQKIIIITFKNNFSMTMVNIYG